MTNPQADRNTELTYIDQVSNLWSTELTIEEVEILAAINGVEAYLWSSDNHWYGFSENSNDADSIKWLLLDRELLNRVLDAAKKFKDLEGGNTEREWSKSLRYSNPVIRLS